MDKFGVALAVSFAGILYARIRHNRMKRPSDPPPSTFPFSSDHSKEVDYGGRLRIRDHPESEIDSFDLDDKPCIRIYDDSLSARASPDGRYSRDKDGFLLPEFDELVNDLNTNTSDVLDQNVEGIMIKNDDYEHEIQDLRRRVRYLREREIKLEVQLLEYYGLKEQETTITELQNQLRVNNIEAELFSAKIRSLQTENNRLAAQVVDYSKVLSDLEDAKAKIKFLRKTIREEAQRNKEQILDLTQRVIKLPDQENEACSSDSGGHSELHRKTDLESQVEELRKCNESLKKENDEFARLLESTQFLANSLFEDPEKDDITNETLNLKEENMKLTKEVERLQADRYTNTEELVYLRWINACLRFELRDYQPPAGKTVARDLSKGLSPNSEKKAKQLILEYSNSEEGDQKPPSIVDFDFDNWPSSLPSYLTDSTEHDDSPRHGSDLKHRHKKSNLLTKIRKLIMGKHGHNDRISPIQQPHLLNHDNTRRCSSESPRSSSCYEGGNNETATPASPSQNRNYSSLEFLPLLRLDEQDPKDIARTSRSSTGGVRFTLGSKSLNNFPFDYRPDEDSENGPKLKLAKYAEALKDSRSLPKMHKKSASHSAVLR